MTGMTGMPGYQGDALDDKTAIAPPPDEAELGLDDEALLPAHLGRSLSSGGRAAARPVAPTAAAAPRPAAPTPGASPRPARASTTPAAAVALSGSPFRQTIMGLPQVNAAPVPGATRADAAAQLRSPGHRTAADDGAGRRPSPAGAGGHLPGAGPAGGLGLRSVQLPVPPGQAGHRGRAPGRRGSGRRRGGARAPPYHVQKPPGSYNLSFKQGRVLEVRADGGDPGGRVGAHPRPPGTVARHRLRADQRSAGPAGVAGRAAVHRQRSRRARRRAPTSRPRACRRAATCWRSRATRGSSPGGTSSTRSRAHPGDPRDAGSGAGRSGSVSTITRPAPKAPEPPPDAEPAARAHAAEHAAREPTGHRQRRPRRAAPDRPRRPPRPSPPPRRRARRPSPPASPTPPAAVRGRTIEPTTPPVTAEPTETPSAPAPRPASCTVTIGSKPWSEVWIDGAQHREADPAGRPQGALRPPQDHPEEPRAADREDRDASPFARARSSRRSSSCSTKRAEEYG